MKKYRYIFILILLSMVLLYSFKTGCIVYEPYDSITEEDSNGPFESMCAIKDSLEQERDSIEKEIEKLSSNGIECDTLKRKKILLDIEVDNAEIDIWQYLNFLAIENERTMEEIKEEEKQNKETANETLFIILVASAMICAVYCIKNWKNKC